MWDHTQLFLVGIGANNAKLAIYTALQEHFPCYTIFTTNIDNCSQHINELSGDKIFNVVKEIEIGDSGESQPVKMATCDLILQAENITRKHAPYTAYYAYVSAHLILEEKDCEKLLKEDLADIQVTIMNKEIAGAAVHTNYFLELPGSNKRLSLRPAPIFWNYRHYKRVSDENAALSFESFLNDSALVEIEGRELFLDKDTIISRDELTSAMTCGAAGQMFGQVLPIDHPDELLAMAIKNVSVIVGGAFGYMIPPGIFINECTKTNSQVEDPQHLQQQPTTTPNSQMEQESENRQLLHHIQFILEKG